MVNIVQCKIKKLSNDNCAHINNMEKDQQSNIITKNDTQSRKLN